MGSTTASTEEEEDKGFFDDDNNVAMYLVLPAIIFVYGGCAFIYCVHRCKRFLRRMNKKKAKRKQRAEMESDRKEK